jgi:hypothetical protein
MSDTPDFEGASKRAESVMDDLRKGLIHRPQREQLAREVATASKGDKAMDAIQRSTR